MSSEEEAVAWLRRAIEARRALARSTIKLGNAEHWQELSSGVLMTCRPDDPQDRLDGLHSLGDSTLTRLMEANDPQDTLARCDAELAILDLHRGEWIDYPGGIRECIACEMPSTPGTVPCQTVHLLASGYRHRLGYAGHWGVRT